jgi:uncharacterized damage-inducible protein DinB
VIELSRIQHLYAYHRWRVQRMCQVLMEVDDAALHKPMQGSFETLAKLLGHMIGAERLWMERIKRGLAQQAPIDAQLPSFEGASVQDLATAWRDCAEEWLDLLLPLSEEWLVKTITYKNTRGEQYSSRLSDVLLHVQNHATYHTGQLVAVYRALGLTPPSTDYIAYVRLPA